MHPTLENYPKIERNIKVDEVRIADWMLGGLDAQRFSKSKYKEKSKIEN